MLQKWDRFMTGSIFVILNDSGGVKGTGLFIRYALCCRSRKYSLSILT